MKAGVCSCGGRRPVVRFKRENRARMCRRVAAFPSDDFGGTVRGGSGACGGDSKQSVLGFGSDGEDVAVLDQHVRQVAHGGLAEQIDERDVLVRFEVDGLLAVEAGVSGRMGDDDASHVGVPQGVDVLVAGAPASWCRSGRIVGRCLAAGVAPRVRGMCGRW